MASAGARRIASASVAVSLDLPELVRRADRILVADVVSVDTGWDRGHRIVLSRASLVVRERWKGELAVGERFSIVQPGGARDGIVTRVEGLPPFVSGERALLFLEGPAQASALVGLGQGKRRLYREATTGDWTAAPADRSAALAGGLAPSPLDVSPAPLSELRRRVHALAGDRRP